jgi:DNA-directed RNA polymerase specialized sigma24 family protein
VQLLTQVIPRLEKLRKEGQAGQAGQAKITLAEFVQAASPSLLRAALVLLNSREDAEDALQITMLRTYRRWEQAKEAPLAYAGTVLVNACRESWRYRGRHPEISQDLDEFANVVSFAEAVDRRHVLVRVLLPDIQREVLVCRYRPFCQFYPFNPWLLAPLIPG